MQMERIPSILSSIAAGVVIVGGIVGGVAWVIDLKIDPLKQTASENKAAMEKVREQLSGVNRKLTGIDTRLGALEKRLTTLEARHGVGPAQPLPQHR